MKKLKRIFVLGVLCMLIASCTKGTADNSVQAEKTPEVKEVSEVKKVEREDGCNLLTFYWKGTADLETSDVWIWWDGKDGSGYPLVPCEYGGMCSVNVPDHITEVGFIVRTDCSDPCQNWGHSRQRSWLSDRCPCRRCTRSSTGSSRGRTACQPGSS